MIDAVPKKRGPKTDVLEALLKRVDGLEAKLKEKNADQDSTKIVESAIDEVDEEEPTDDVETTAPKRVATGICRSSNEVEPGIATDVKPSPRLDMPPSRGGNAEQEDRADLLCRINPASPAEADAFLDTYFTRFHGKPYYILDESSTRQKIQLNQLPDCLACGIWAVSSRCVDVLPTAV